jgi:DNA-binding HxlR family transcriptional regulator
MEALNFDKEFCKQKSLALRDAIELFSGKWKFCIIQILSYGTKRVKDFQETVF